MKILSPVWILLRIFELVDQKIRHESHYNGLIYDKLYIHAVKYLRRAGNIINKDDFAVFHEETIVDFPILTNAEWQKIIPLVQQNIKDIEQKIQKSQDATENDIMQFEVILLNEFLANVQKKLLG